MRAECPNMKKHGIGHLVEGLREIPDEQFNCDEVYQYLSDNPVELDSISRYFFWSERFYTRNLIYKDPRFELMSVCWEKGQSSPIHNHADQMCWMMVVDGRLRGQNFSVREIDEARGYCKLDEADRFELSECLAAKVELENPVHQILNLSEFDQRAVSLHIYSKPFDHCLSYTREDDSFSEIPLCYTSVDGRLCDDIAL